MLAKTIFPLLSLVFLFQLTFAANPTYQEIHQACQDKKAACVAITYTQGCNRATLEGKPMNCASDGDAAMICSYAAGNEAFIRCKGSDSIEGHSTGTIIQAIFYGNAEQNFLSSGDGTSIFVASCLTRT